MNLSSTDPIYKEFVRGRSNEQIALVVGHMPSSVKVAIKQLLDKLGMRRTEFLLEYIRDHHCDDQLPVEDYSQAVTKILRLKSHAQRIIAIMLECWLTYMANKPLQGPPSEMDIMRALGCDQKNGAIGRAMHYAAATCDMLPVYRFQLIRLFFISGQKILGDCRDERVLRALQSALTAERPLAAYQVVRWPAFYQDVPVALAFVEAHCPDDLLPLAAYRRAHNVMRQLRPSERKLLALYLEQWKLHTKGNAGKPSVSGVAQLLGLSAQTVQLRFAAIAGYFGYPGVAGHYAELAAAYYMAMLYPILCLDE